MNRQDPLRDGSFTEKQAALVGGLKEYLKNSHSSFHAVRLLKEALLEEGYRELRENQPWKAEAGKGCFVIRNSSSLLAFRLPEETPVSAHIVAVHSDSPVFKLKPDPEPGYLRRRGTNIFD